MMNTLLNAIGIILIFYLPGYLINRLFNLKIKDFELIFLEVSTSIMLTGLIGFVLAQFAIFSINLLYSLLALVCITTFLRGKKPFNFNPKKLFLIACFAIIISSVIFLKPQETFHGGLDPGVYINTGVNIANTGAILISSRIIQELRQKNITSFYQLRSEPRLGTYGNQLPGFYITDTEKGIITPQFYHLYPVWIAIFYSIFGLKGTLFVVPLFSILSLMTIFLFTKRILNTRVAILSVGLLSISFPQVWYSLIPNSEIMMQFFLFLSLYCLHLYTQEKLPEFGVFGAFAMANALLTRIDFIFVVPVIIAYLLYLHATKERIQLKYFVIPFSILIIYTTITAFTLAKPYTLAVYWGLLIVPITKFSLKHISTNYWIFIACIMAILFAIMVIRKKEIKITEKQKIILAFAAWTTIAAFYILSHKIIPGMSNNFVTLSWYVTPIGFFIGILGLLMMPWHKNNSVMLTFAIFATILSFYSIQAAITPVHPWWVRRFLPAVLPILFIGISYFIFENKIFTRNLSKKIFSVVMIAVLTLMFIPMTATMFAADESDGLTEIISGLNQSIIEPSLVLIYSKDGNAHKYAAPLNYIYGKDILLVKEFNETARSYIANLAKDKTIYLLVPSQSTINILSQEFQLEKIYQITITWKTMSRQPKWKSFYKKLYYLPDKPTQLRHNVTLYRLQPKLENTNT